MKKIIIAANPGGISNRLKCLISLWRISERYNQKFYLNWIKNDRCGAEFSELFENDLNQISNEEINNLNPEKYILSETWRFLTLKDDVPDKFAKEYPTPRGNNIDFEFDRIPLKVREDIISYLKRLVPIKEIREKVKWFDEKYNLSNLIGLHIRRGDFLDGKEGLGKVSTDDKFIEKIKLISVKVPTIKFLLCTDDPKIEDRFLKEFGNKIIIYPKVDRKRDNLECTKDGLIDLLLLSKVKYIIGTYKSTFNELAWWLGGCKAQVEILIDEDLKEQYEIKKKKLSKSKYNKFKRWCYKRLQRVKGGKR